MIETVIGDTHLVEHKYEFNFAQNSYGRAYLEMELTQK